MKSLAISLFAALFALAAAAAFADNPTAADLASPWWDSEHVQLNPAAGDDKPAPAPDTDKDKDKS